MYQSSCNLVNVLLSQTAATSSPWRQRRPWRLRGSMRRRLYGMNCSFLPDSLFLSLNYFTKTVNVLLLTNRSGETSACSPVGASGVPPPSAAGWALTHIPSAVEDKPSEASGTQSILMLACRLSDSLWTHHMDGRKKEPRAEGGNMWIVQYVTSLVNLQTNYSYLQCFKWWQRKST